MNAIRLPDAEATLALAARVARALPATQEQPVYVALHGGLGAGKTTFVQGFLAALGVAGPVHSPTYALVETYEAGGRLLVHADLYRLAQGAGFEELGLRELFAGRAVWLVEWPEKAGRQLPEPDLTVWFGVLTNGRECRIDSGSSFGAEWLQAVGTPGSDPGSRA